MHIISTNLFYRDHLRIPWNMNNTIIGRIFIKSLLARNKISHEIFEIVLTHCLSNISHLKPNIKIFSKLYKSKWFPPQIVFFFFLTFYIVIFHNQRKYSQKISENDKDCFPFSENFFWNGVKRACIRRTTYICWKLSKFTINIGECFWIFVNSLCE